MIVDYYTVPFNNHLRRCWCSSVSILLNSSFSPTTDLNYIYIVLEKR
jgi:hypothetical protein